MPPCPQTLLRMSTGLVSILTRIGPVEPVKKVRRALRLIA